MDIDVLAANQRMELMKKGACFNCRVVGHLSWDCLNKKKEEPKKEERKKWKGKELAAYMQAQMLEILAEEKNAFYKDAQDQVFETKGCLNVYPFITIMYSVNFYRTNK